MKVLYVVNDLHGKHGWSTYTRNTVDSLLSVGQQAVVLVHDKELSYKPEIQEDVIEYIPYECLWNPLKIWRLSRVLKKAIKEHRPDLVHVTVEPYVMALAFVRINVPVILTVHGTYVHVPSVVKGLRSFVSSLLFDAAHKKISKIIAVSEKTKQHYKRLAGNHRPIEVIHNSFKKDESNGLSTQTEESDSMQVITVGAVKIRKGINEAIDLLSAWADEYKKPIVYNVVGSFDLDNSYCAKVAEKAKTLKSEYFTVKFHDEVSENEKIRLLQLSDMYIHLEPVGVSNDVEGFGIGIIEAAAYGLPAIVSKEGAVAEAVIDGVTGYHVSFHDKQEAFAKIDHILLDHSIKREDLDDWVEKHHPEIIFEDIYRIYNDELKS